MTTLPRFALLGALAFAGCQGAPPESASTTALECQADPTSDRCKQAMAVPHKPDCDPAPVPPDPCANSTAADCQKMPCADGSTNCPPSPCEPGKMCPSPVPTDPSCVCVGRLSAKTSSGEHFEQIDKLDLSGKPIADVKQCADVCHLELLALGRQLCSAVDKPGDADFVAVSLSIWAYFGAEQLTLEAGGVCGSF